VVATPHFRFDLGTVDAGELVHRVCELRAHLAAFGVPLETRCGAELGHDVVGSLSQYELQLLAQGPPDARWLLVEAPFEGFGADFQAATAELRERGLACWSPIPSAAPTPPSTGQRGGAASWVPDP
jgi:protein-tyrosine phosphatase